MLLFWGAAIFGTVLFVLRTITFFVGGFGQEPDDLADDAPAEDDHPASEGAFKLLSLNSLTGFIAMFGWAGLTAHAQFRLPFSLSVLLGGVCGFLVMALAALLFWGALKLRSAGAVFNINRTPGLAGEVYLRIPADNSGRVSVTVQGVKRQIDAVSDTGNAIGSFEKVLIVRAVDARTVAVVPFDDT
jgi:hypothetical protein